MKKRSDCPCHKPANRALHMGPCCVPDEDWEDDRAKLAENRARSWPFIAAVVMSQFIVGDETASVTFTPEDLASIDDHYRLEASLTRGGYRVSITPREARGEG